MSLYIIVAPCSTVYSLKIHTDESKLLCYLLSLQSGLLQMKSKHRNVMWLLNV
jgi:hypothetical protein